MRLTSEGIVFGRNAKVIACLTLTLAIAASSSIIGQSSAAPWMEMSKKHAEELLNDSPWSQTQVDTDTSEMFFSPTRLGTASPGRSTAAGAADRKSTRLNSSH